MKNASREFRDKVDNGANLVNYADVTLSNGTVLHLTPKDFMIGGCSLTDATTDGSGFTIGNAIGKSVRLRIANHEEQYSGYDFYMATVYLYLALTLDDGTVEKIREGKFYVNEPTSPGDTIEINAVDGMVKFDRPYDESSTSYPATLFTVMTDACLDCDVVAGFGHFDGDTFTVAEKPKGLTYRQVVSCACQIAGYNARMNSDDALGLVRHNTEMLREEVISGLYTDTKEGEIWDGGLFTDPEQTEILDGGLFTDEAPYGIYHWKNLTVATDDVIITGVKVINDEKEYMYGSMDYAVILENNPFTVGKEQEVADYLGKLFSGIRFRPFEGKITGNPLYEPFDVCDIYERKGNCYRTLINSVEFTVGSGTVLSCQAEAPLRNGSTYRSEAARAAAEARRITEKKMSTYEQKAQQMNELAGNAMGYHTTYESLPDGSIISYLHDKPSLSESQTIYKQTAEGFFISGDGGKTYTMGFDKNGNAVMNILAAIGIVCDWIKGGTLTLGGNGNINGTMALYDENGVLTGRWDNSGMNIYKGLITGSRIKLGGDNNGYGILELFGPNGEGYASLTGSDGLFVTKGFLGGFTISNRGINGYSSRFVSSSTENDIEISSGFLQGYKAYPKTVHFALGYSGGAYLTLKSHDGNSEVFLRPDVMNLYNGDIHARSLSLSGTKSRIADTFSYSRRLLYCYEMPKPYFGDMGEAKLDQDGVCYIFPDDIFIETVNTECNYQVFLQKYGPGDLWVKSRTPSCFVVEGTPGLPFAWEIKARQRGYEAERLETFTDTELEKTVDYEQEAQNYVENYYKEMLNYE